MNRLEGKVVIVTGAAQGIGHAVATLFTMEGAEVTAADIKDPVEDYGADVAFTRLDVSDPENWKRVVAEVEGRHGRIDALINNAGIGFEETLVDTTDERWAQVIAVTQTGVFLGMREVVPVMQRGQGGSIVNFSSIWGIAAVGAAASYHAAKGAVRMLSKNAAVTYASDGIRVNSIHPGFVDTPLTRGQDPELSKAVIAATPLGRAGRPEELAHACLFLASEESSFVTGSELVVDGGYLAQ
jgi:3alpha(or 20beta)-hydroxysteroid dehydrogenase